MSAIDNPWFVYIIKCHDGSLYTGITKDVQKRFAQHCAQNKKTAKYLRGKMPLVLVYQREVGTHSEALKIEAEIKKLNPVQKAALIQD